MKVYPVFVNFFEMSKETVMKCDRERPRFHAFLKVLFMVVQKRIEICFMMSDLLFNSDMS